MSKTGVIEYIKLKEFFRKKKFINIKNFLFTDPLKRCYLMEKLIPRQKFIQKVRILRESVYMRPTIFS
jgi:hypothetical protein